MTPKTQILIVEDEPAIRDILSTAFSHQGYSVVEARTLAEGLTLAASHQPDLILLDLGLPDGDGMTLLHKIREWSTVPIIVVSARQNEEEKVEALDAGADDYVTKPFGNQELLARARTSLRRHQALANPQHSQLFCVDGLVLDFKKRTLNVDGNAVHLTPIEYKIVALLAKHTGQVLTHDAIIKEVWGPYASDSQVLRVNMANIRRKIEKNPADPQYILTEVGVGYRMAEPGGGISGEILQ